MIKSNLAVIMAQKGYRTIKKVSEETGISRTTLTALYYNKCTGIQFDTLEKLCDALTCEVGELLYINKNLSPH